jgi:hypothetical protein
VKARKTAPAPSATTIEGQKGLQDTGSFAVVARSVLGIAVGKGLPTVDYPRAYRPHLIPLSVGRRTHEDVTVGGRLARAPGHLVGQSARADAALSEDGRIGRGP